MKRRQQWRFPVLLRKDLYNGLLLTYVGGFLDGYTYLGKGHVFANAQTGNIALLGISLFSLDLNSCLHYLLPILSFALGSFLCHLPFFKRTQALLAEILILALVTLAGEHLADQYGNMLISLVCAMQVTTFRKIETLPYASTMCTGNLRSATEKLYAFFSKHDITYLKQAMTYFLVIGCFILGAGSALIALHLWGLKALYICCVILLLNVRLS